MIELQLAIFDGHVLEFFYKEKYSLQIKGEYLLAVTDVSEAILSQAQELVAAIHKAMEESKR